MINLAVINIKDIIKNLVKLVIIIITIILFTRFFKSMRKLDLEEFFNKRFENLNNKTFLECLNENIGQFTYSEKDEKEKKNMIISQEILFAGLLNSEEDHSIEDNFQFQETIPEENENKKINELVPNGNVETQVIDDNNKKDVYTNKYGTVEIKNESKYNLTEEMLKPDIDFTNKKDIVIFHTHTCESYTPTDKFNYNQTGNYRTTDLNYSVARVR